MKILSIGNSFSQDAQRYLYQIARAGGYDIKAVNLYIGGCPLKKHYRNMLGDKKDYSLELNGCSSGFFVSIKDALLSDDWDYITFQQLSSDAPKYETYEPYLSELAAFVRKCCPKAKLLMHQTWAYCEGGERLIKEMGYKRMREMTDDITDAYKKAADSISADGIIPCGQLMQALSDEGFIVHRDGFHARYGFGRYALGLMWYGYILKGDIDENKFADTDEPMTTEEIDAAKRCVKAILG